ncbi:MAG: DUF934 domain-containing protein [Caulobacteraceae bacterium]
MPKLIKLDGETALWTEDAFVFVPDEEPVPAEGDIVVTMARLLGEGDALLSSGRRVGVRLQPHEQVEDLAYDLPRLAVVELAFAKFRDGRPYSTARVLRGRLEYRGEVRAIGDVLREQALHMVRCGFDAFVPADGSSPDEWLAAAHRYRHVYQRAADDRQPIYVERDLSASGLGHNRPDEVGV